MSGSFPDEGGEKPSGIHSAPVTVVCQYGEDTRRTHAKEPVASIAKSRREAANHPAAKRLTEPKTKSDPAIYFIPVKSELPRQQNLLRFLQVQFVNSPDIPAETLDFHVMP